MTIFLSASVPDPRRHEKYHGTADVIAIRDAIRALVTVALPVMRLVWGGHPAITPLVRVVAQDLGITGKDKISLFQSGFFAGQMPADNAAFEKVIVIPAVNADREASLRRMRTEMLGSENFAAGVFIGGMEGVEIEFEMFRELHRKAKVLPVASTGAAALHLYNRDPKQYPTALLDDYAYPSLFRNLLDFPPQARS